MDTEVIIRSAGQNPIVVIKQIREATGVGLAEAKDLALKTPSTSVLDRERAEQFAQAATQAGATVELAAAPAAPAGNGGAEAGDLVSQLERLSALRTSGAISDEEFEQLKYRLLAGT